MRTTSPDYTLRLWNKAELLPAYISRRPGLFRRVHVYFHDPVSIKDIAARGINKEACDAVMERIAGVYREMVAEHEKSVG